MGVNNVHYVLKRNKDIEARTAIFRPRRNAADAVGGNFWGVEIQLGNFFTGPTSSHCYGVGITGDRETGYVATGDANDAYLRISGNNYAANDSNFVYRGINAGVNNRSGGTMGRMEHSFGVQNKSGGTVPTLLVATLTAENYGTTATEMGVADFIHRNEGAAPTTTYGIRIRNDDQSGVAGAVQSAINIASHASSGGFRELIDASGAVLTEYDSGTQVVLMKFQGANGTTYYLVHDTNTATVVAVSTSVS
jgi:hypothetical protein